LADNTKQLRWIVVLFGNLAALLRDCLDVFVASDLLWYPIEGEVEISTAPDVLVTFGRPKGDRRSYRQWEEGNIPITVAFEVLSHCNTHTEMIDKQAFYEEHGVEEYYVYDPDRNRLFVYLRKGEMLRRVNKVDGFVSPRLGIRFDLSGPEMVVYHPSGRRFLSFEELDSERVKLKAEREKLQADRDNEHNLRLVAESRAVRLAELSRKARLQQASPAELQELERLENETAPSP
jgi:Uma2 family endonuclease